MKPRKFSFGAAIHGECREVDGEKIIDTRCDLYDGAESAKELARYAEWLRRACKWLKEPSDD
jgi:hypothetical protein